MSLNTAIKRNFRIKHHMQLKITTVKDVIDAKLFDIDVSDLNLDTSTLEKLSYGVAQYDVNTMTRTEYQQILLSQRECENLLVQCLQEHIRTLPTTTATYQPCEHQSSTKK